MVISLADRERPPGRQPKPDLRLNVLGVLAATSIALVAYFFALLVNFRPPPTFAGVLFTIAPACAIPATVLLSVRARAEQDDALRAVTGGLTVGCVAMVLQLTSFRPIDPGGGLFGTSTAGSSMLYVLWHVALPAGALAATIGRPRRNRRIIGVTFGIGLVVLCATIVPDSWRVVHSDGSYYGGLVIALGLVVCFTLAVVLRWMRINGLRPSATRGWITIAMVLSVYDVALNVLGHQRFGDIWWASLGLRGLTYAVLLAGLIVNTARQLQRLERYATTELARAEGEVNSWAEVTERLLAATSALSAAVTADDVAVLLTAAGASAIEVEDGVIYLVDHETPGRFRLIGDLREAELTHWVDAAQGHPYSDALLSRSAIFLENAEQISHAYPNGVGLPDTGRLQSLVALPLVAGDVPVGALVLAGRRARDFRRLDRELLSGLVRVGAQALQRALLFEQQSSLATTLQEALLPQSLPTRDDVELIGRYLPATAGVDVGGDWYDVLELEGSRLLLVVGDVMGKGVPAATLMGQMRSAVRTLAAVDPDPAAILSGLDRLARGFALDDIVTLVIVALDTEAGSAVVANAGHLQPLIFTPGQPGAPVTTAVNMSPPIGVPVSGPRASQQLQLAPGTGLLLLTDGLVEERTNDLDLRMASLAERATELLADPEADLETVADALVQPRIHREDDVTVLLARLRSKAEGTPESAAGNPQATCLLHVELEHDSGSAATARGLVREAVLAELPTASEDLLDAMLLVTSELVTNGLRHGEPPVLLTVDRKGRRMRLTVSDEGSRIPRPRLASPDATGGRGLFLVSALSTAWRIEPHSADRAGSGTSVWAEFAL